MFTKNFGLTSIIFSVLIFNSAALATTVYSYKYPDTRTETGYPVLTPAEVPDFSKRELRGAGSFTDLIPYILPSPNQQDAGSCLYMATTGMAEWWKAKLAGNVQPKSESEFDLSERYLMNIAGDENTDLIKNALTDTILAFNGNGSRAILNRDYPFTMGWMIESAKGYVKAPANAPNASYTTSYNWINELATIHAQPVSLPFFSRNIIFVDPAQDRWNVNVAPADIVNQVKTLLQKNKAPVTIIYNHYLYWHAVNIVGFDDNASTEGCKFTSGFPAYAREQAKTADPQKALRWEKYAASVESATASEGGCKEKGVFYVRDSLYTDENGEVYDYDRTQTGDEENYTKKVIQREYQWLKRFSNHLYQIQGEYKQR